MKQHWAAYLSGGSKGLNGSGLNRQVKVLGDVVSASDNGNVIQQRLSPLTKSRGLDCAHLKEASQALACHHQKAKLAHEEAMTKQECQVQLVRMA